MAWIWSLLVICLAAAGAVIAFTLTRVGSGGRAQVFARLSIGAGISAVGSTLMYAIYETTNTVLALVVGDVFMVLAPGGILLALRALSGRLRTGIVVVASAVVVVALTTALVGNPDAVLVKVSALLLLCVLTARETRVAPVAGMVGATTLLVVYVGYAAFSLGRIVVGLAFGMDSPLYQAVFSIYPTTAVGIAAVAATGVAVIRMAAALGPHGGPSTPHPESGYRVNGWLVSLPGGADLRAAFGGATASRLDADLRDACEAIGADAASGHEVTTGVSSRQAFSRVLRAELQSRGWSESEIALVAIVPDGNGNGNGNRNSDEWAP